MFCYLGHYITSIPPLSFHKHLPCLSYSSDESVPSIGDVPNRALSSVTRHAHTKKSAKPCRCFFPETQLYVMHSALLDCQYLPGCLPLFLLSKVKETVWMRDTQVFPEFHRVSQSLLALVVLHFIGLRKPC